MKTQQSCLVTTERRKKFSDALKKMQVTGKSQITSSVQVDLFRQFDSWEDRCALRRFLTDEYEMVINADGILSEIALAKAIASADKTVLQTEGALV